MRTTVKTILDGYASQDAYSDVFTIGEPHRNLALMVIVTGADGYGTATVQGSLDGTNFAIIGPDSGFGGFALSAGTYLYDAYGTHTNTPAVYGEALIDGYTNEGGDPALKTCRLINMNNVAFKYVRVKWDHYNITVPTATIQIQAQASS